MDSYDIDEGKHYSGEEEQVDKMDNSHNTIKKRPKKKIKIESSKNNPPKNVDVLGYMKDIIKQFFYYCYHYYY